MRVFFFFCKHLLYEVFRLPIQNVNSVLTAKNICFASVVDLKEAKVMPLSHYGEFDGESTSNQFAAQSQRIPSAVSVESQSMANPIRMRCKLNSTNVEEKRNYSFS